MHRDRTDPIRAANELVLRKYPLTIPCTRGRPRGNQRCITASRTHCTVNYTMADTRKGGPGGALRTFCILFLPFLHINVLLAIACSSDSHINSLMFCIFSCIDDISCWIFLFTLVDVTLNNVFIFRILLFVYLILVDGRVLQDHLDNSF